MADFANRRASRGRYIFDQDDLAECRTHAFGDDAAECIGGAASRACGNKRYWSGWKALRRRDAD
jgi:hypothetical protein